jgi:ABC-type enterobactin transport system permease subunit
MFEQLEDLGKVRSRKQAFGFYIAYLLMYMFLGAVSGIAVAVVFGSSDTALISKLSAIGSTIVTALICFVMVRRKGLGFGFWLVSILACGLTIFGGGLLGLLIPAYMTTAADLHESDDSDEA